MIETIRPIIMPPRFSAVRDSKRSAPLPASSPTLSPTLSAIAAGFLGSSSGKFSSTFPTRSAPTTEDSHERGNDDDSDDYCDYSDCSELSLEVCVGAFHDRLPYRDHLLVPGRILLDR